MIGDGHRTAPMRCPDELLRDHNVQRAIAVVRAQRERTR